MRAWTWPALLLALVPGTAAGQGLAERTAGVSNGVARFAFPVREGVEICRQGIRMGEDRMRWRWGRGSDSIPLDCRQGPLEVEITIRDGLAERVEVIGGWNPSDIEALDLGSFQAREAVDYLLALVRSRSSSRGVGGDAVFPAFLADVDEVWRELLVLARDHDAGEDARESALFWLGQEAAHAVTEGLAGVALDEDEDQEIRDAAVFALSQRPADEGVPILMEVARSADEAATRKSAMFWLAQSGDERVVRFFEEVLLGRGGGGE